MKIPMYVHTYIYICKEGLLPLATSVVVKSVLAPSIFEAAIQATRNSVPVR